MRATVLNFLRLCSLCVVAQTTSASQFSFATRLPVSSRRSKQFSGIDTTKRSTNESQIYVTDLSPLLRLRGGENFSSFVGLCWSKQCQVLDFFIFGSLYGRYINCLTKDWKRQIIHHYDTSSIWRILLQSLWVCNVTWQNRCQYCICGKSFFLLYNLRCV